MEFVEETNSIIRFWCGDNNLQKSIFENSDEKLFEFVETLALSAKYHFHNHDILNDSFSFVANSSLSGGSHPCSAFECRISKLNQLISFSALYSDNVFIQNPFEKIYLREKQEVREVDRWNILFGIQSYLYLKPLIEKGLIKYAISSFNFCESHHESLAKPLAQEIVNKEEKLFEILEKHLIEKCTVTFDFNDEDKSKPFFKIEGPESIIEHGITYLHVYTPMPSSYQLFLNKKTPYILAAEEIKLSRILDQVIGPIIDDLSAQEWHSKLNGTSYLCDNPSQIKLASKLNSGSYAADSAAFEKGLKHYLPTIYSSDALAILDLRNKENEAFAVYRDKLRKMFNESKQWNEKEVSSIFRDQLLPEINLINKKVKDWKSNVRESVSQKVLFGTATASFGLYSGVLPTNIGEIVAALGGASAIAGSLMEYNKTLKVKQEARKNDFYFLWQANDLTRGS